jgi:hypothetical protein
VRVGEGRGVGEHEGKIKLGRPRRTWQDNIKVSLL